MAVSVCKSDSIKTERIKLVLGTKTSFDLSYTGYIGVYFPTGNFVPNSGFRKNFAPACQLSQVLLLSPTDDLSHFTECMSTIVYITRNGHLADKPTRGQGIPTYKLPKSYTIVVV